MNSKLSDLPASPLLINERKRGLLEHAEANAGEPFRGGKFNATFRGDEIVKREEHPVEQRPAMDPGPCNKTKQPDRPISQPGLQHDHDARWTFRERQPG